MKVIFLDFDGVLNNLSSGALNVLKNGDGGLFMGIAAPNPVSVELMDILFSKDDIKIVVSSSWRHGRTIDELKEILEKEFNLKYWFRVIDKTRNSGYVQDEVRGNQIDDWLNANKDVTHYCIIDDSTDMLSHHEDNFVNTSLELGFGIEDFKRAKKILEI